MINRLGSLWNPGSYHGKAPDIQFFEGWYFKVISADQEERLAIIPGVFNHPDPDRRHAFVQILNGITNDVIYHRFESSAFNSSKSEFSLRIAENHFHTNGCILNLDSQGQVIVGELVLEDQKPWPVRLFSPGVMGPFGFVPFMQTYHGILSLDHSLQGSLEVNGRKLDFSDGRGYTEKDWGSTFPRAYVWMQSNHFPERGVSLTASVATIPWLGNWFRGFLIGLLVDGILYRFTTYLGSKITSLKVTDTEVRWRIIGDSRTCSRNGYPGYRLNIIAKRGEGGLLSSPELDGMTPRILESLTANIWVELLSLNESGQVDKILYHGSGTCGGLEVAGAIDEIVDPEDKEDS